MTRLLVTASALLLMAGAAQAQTTPSSPVAGIVADLQEQGYTRIEIKPGRGVTEIEAIRGSEKLELDVVSRTGKVVKSETETVRPDENTTPGVYLDRDGRGRDDSASRNRSSSDDSSDGYDDSDGRDDDDSDDDSDDDRDDDRDDDSDDDGDDDSDDDRGDDDRGSDDD